MNLVLLENIGSKLLHQCPHVAVVDFICEVVHFELQDRPWVFVLTETSIFPAESGLVFLRNVGLFKVELDDLAAFEGL